jgi:hypothetical protein
MPGDKRQLELDLLARNRMGSATEAAARDLARVGDAADKAGHKADAFGRDTELASEGAKHLGHGANDAREAIARLDHEIHKAKQDLVLLAGELAAAGTAAERLDVSKGIRKSEADIRRLTKGKGILEDLLPDPGPAVQSWASKLASNLQTSIKDALSSNILGTAGAVVGVALGPSIGAGIATAVTGTVGLGGVIGGLALAAKNPAVKAQAHHIGSTFMAGITEQAETSFAGPMQNVLGKLSAFASASVPKIGRIFANTAPSVGLLADNLSRAGTALLDSFVYASAKSGPALAALGKLTQGVAEDVGKFIQTMADHSAQGVSAIDDLSGALHHLVETASGVVSGLASLKGVQDGIDKWVDDKRSWLEDHTHFLDLTADGYKRGSAAAKLYRQGVIGAAGSVNDYNHYLAAQAAGTGKAAGAMNAAARAARGERGAMSELADELRAQSDPAFALIKAQNDLKKAQQGAAKATQQHGANSWQAREATRKLAQAAIELQGRVGALGNSFTGKLSPAMLNTLRAAGLTKAQIAAVGREFMDAKRKGDSFARKYAAAIALMGVGKSIADVNRLQAKIFGLRGKIVTIGTRVVGEKVRGGTIPFAKGGIVTHADTGALRDASLFTSVSSGARYAFAEPSTGGEAFIPKRGDMARSRAIWEYVGRNWLGARSGGGGGRGGGGRLVIDVTGADAEMKRLIRKMIRTEGL